MCSFAVRTQKTTFLIVFPDVQCSQSNDVDYHVAKTGSQGGYKIDGEDT